MHNPEEDTDDLRELRKVTERLAKHTLQIADIVISTPVQGRMDLLKDVHFDYVIIDEASVMSSGQLLCAWREQEILLMIGDDAQLSTVCRSTSETNPMHACLEHNAFQRFLEMGVPYYMFKEQMRMRKGLMDCANQIFYDGLLVDGINTDLKTGDLSVALKAYLNDKYPIRPEPEGEIQPVFLSVEGLSYKQENGSSNYNPQNVSVVLDLMKDMVKNVNQIHPGNFGICAGYEEQVNRYYTAVKILAAEQSIVGWNRVYVGVAEYWQGKEEMVTIVGFVRAQNNHGQIGYMSKAKRINVLITRSSQGMIIVGDHRFINLNLDEQQDDQQDVNGKGKGKAKDQKCEDDICNVWMVRTTRYFFKKGRFVDIPGGDLSQRYVEFPAAPLTTRGFAGNDASGEQAGGTIEDPVQEPEAPPALVEESTPAADEPVVETSLILETQSPTEAIRRSQSATKDTTRRIRAFTQTARAPVALPLSYKQQYPALNSRERRDMHYQEQHSRPMNSNLFTSNVGPGEQYLLSDSNPSYSSFDEEAQVPSRPTPRQHAQFQDDGGSQYYLSLLPHLQPVRRPSPYCQQTLNPYPRYPFLSPYDQQSADHQHQHHQHMSHCSRDNEAGGDKSGSMDGVQFH